MPYVNVEGVRLWVQVDRGPANGPWIVLSNSLAADCSMWDRQVPLLATRYNVVRYDTRGHGRSEAPPGPYTFDVLIDDCRGILDHLDVETFSFLGLSLGGMTGLGMALTYSGRMDQLICCDARADAPPAFVQSWIDRCAAVQAGGMEAIADSTIERWLSPDFRKREAEVTRSVRDMIIKTDAVGYQGCAAALSKLDYLRHLGQIALPVSYVVGSDDSGAPVEVMEDMARRTASSTFDIIQGAAHLPNIDSEDAFNRLLTARLTEFAR